MLLRGSIASASSSIDGVQSLSIGRVASVRDPVKGARRVMCRAREVVSLPPEMPSGRVSELRTATHGTHSRCAFLHPLQPVRDTPAAAREGGACCTRMLERCPDRACQLRLQISHTSAQERSARSRPGSSAKHGTGAGAAVTKMSLTRACSAP